MYFIRTDANEEIATGHMMRCITLADELIQIGKLVTFIISDEKSVSLLERYSYIVLHTKWDNYCTEEEVSQILSMLNNSYLSDGEYPTIIVDSYYVNNSYFEKIKSVARIIYFDDMCEEKYMVDGIINYNITHVMHDYRELYKGQNTRMFLGEKYVPLRKQFSDDFVKKKKDSTFDCLLICGGGDKYNVLSGFMKKIKKMKLEQFIRFHIVVGSYNPYESEIYSLQAEMHNIVVHKNVDNMAELMAECNVAISAASTVLYELCAMGIPTVFFVLADNQEPDIHFFSNDIGMLYSGDIRKERENVICNSLAELKRLYEDDLLRSHMSNNMRKLIDGYGAKRLARAIVRAREIGSFYENDISVINRELDVTQKKYRSNDNNHVRYYIDGRNALEDVLQEIEGKVSGLRKCILPKYTCDTVIIPFENNGWDIYYYDIKMDMTISREYFEKLLEEHAPDVLLMHTYYGQDTLSNVRDIIQKYRKEHNMIYIEDMTQSLYLTNMIKNDADYVVGSLRKWFPIPDGGFGLSINNEFQSCLTVDNYYKEVKEKAQLMKRQYLQGHNVYKEEFLELNRKSEENLYETKELVRMSEKSFEQMMDMDFDLIYSIRNSNMKVLKNGMKSLYHIQAAIDFDEQVAPLYYPIYVDNRESVQKKLQEKDIYVPILWPIPEMILREDMDLNVTYIYEHLLALPCDHRYREKDMEIIIKELKQIEEEIYGR